MAQREVNAGRAVVEVSLRDRIGKGLVAIERRLSMFGRSVATFGAAMTASGLAAVGWPLKLAADMEQTSVAFEVFTGSAAKAKALIAELKTFAANTPFGFTDVSEAANLLLNYGVTAGDIVPMLKLLGDVSQGSALKLKLLTYGYGQIVSRGKLTGDNLRQLTESGFNPLRQMATDAARKLGYTGDALELMADRQMPALTDKMEAGQISVGDVTRAFVSATSAGGRFHNSMEKQSQTGWGLFSKLVEIATYRITEFGMVALEMLKPALRFSIGFVEGVSKIIEANQGLLKIFATVAIGLVAVGAALTTVGLAGLAASTIAGGIAAAWNLVVLSIGFLFSPLGLVVVALTGAAVAAWTFRDAIAAALARAAAYFEPLTRAMFEVWDVFRATFGGIVAALLKGDLTAAAGIAWLGFTAAAWTAIASLGDVLKSALNLLEAWVPGVGSIRDSVTGLFKGIGQAILAGRWDLAGAIMMAKLQTVIAQGWGAISNLWAGAAAGIGAIWDMTVHGIRTGWNKASTALASGMLWVVGKLSQGVTLIINLFDSIATVAHQAVVAVAGFVSGSSDTAAATNKRLGDELVKRGQSRVAADREFNSGTQAALRQQSGATQAGIDRDFQGSMIGRSQGEQATRAANAERVAALQMQVAELERQAAQAAAGAPSIADRAKNASEALNTAIAAAMDEQKAAAAKGMNIADPKLAAAGAGLAKIESRGTFSAAAAATFGAQSSAPEQTARNTGVAARLLRVIADKPAPQFS